LQKPEISAQPVTAVATAVGGGSLDQIKTASIQNDKLLARNQELAGAHSKWCARRYRSYNPQRNSYTRYDGEVWPCVSPYSKYLAVEAQTKIASISADALLRNEAFYANSDHMSYCSSRYRSYRPQDNTYQPFGGGPRRQCH
jgi:hypothetical protein